MCSIHPDWIEDCQRWRGRVLDGEFAHWCHDWDGLPVDETTPEFECCSCQWPLGKILWYSLRHPIKALLFFGSLK